MLDSKIYEIGISIASAIPLREASKSQYLLQKQKLVFHAFVMNGGFVSTCQFTLVVKPVVKFN